MKLVLTLLIAIPVFSLGCSNDDVTGRGSLALSGDIPDADASGEDVRWEVWNGEGRSATLVLANAALADGAAAEAELLALSTIDLDGDGDLELDCDIAGERIFVDVGGRVDADVALALSILAGLESDVDAWADLQALEELELRAGAASDIADALSGFDACALDPEPAIALCLASIELAASCSVAGGDASCSAELAVDVTSAACAASLTALTDGTVACVQTMAAQLSTLEELERLEELEGLEGLEGI